MDNEKLLEQIRKEREQYEYLVELKQEKDRINELKKELGSTVETTEAKPKKNFAGKYVAFCQGFAGAFGVGGKKDAKNNH